MYTDGSCSGNPGPGGYCSIIVYGGAEKVVSGGSAATTNNRMELSGVIEGLKSLREPCEVELWTDSKYVADAITKDWARSWRANGWIKKSDKKPALNADLWEELLRLAETHRLTVNWIRGHDGHEYNERCDKIACEQTKLFMQ